MGQDNKQDGSEELLRDRTELSLLFDFYSGLIDEHKRGIFEDHILNDLSLSEISESAGISRQGVHDIIKRTSKQLRDYEEKLKEVSKYRELSGIIASLEEICEEEKPACELKERIRCCTERLKALF